jgi:osmotically-inducible protein OsmY
MNLVKKPNWMAYAYALPLICGFAAMADAQPEALHVIARSNITAASASQPVDSSTELRERIKAALDAEPYLNDRHINVSVENGSVVLHGIVFGDSDLFDALRVARKAAGSAPVIDNLTLYQSLKR